MWKMFVAVGQSDEAVVFVELGFMDTADSPLPRAFEFAAQTLTTGESDRQVDVSVNRREDDASFSCFVKES